MCVICFKPQGVKMPNMAILKRMYKKNPDGMGFCTPSKVYKTMNFNSFVDHLNDVGDDACIMHFRWATHGSVKKSNCHPFTKGGIKFAHNGVLPIESVDDKTDSQICFENVIYPSIKEFGWRSKEANDIITEAAGFSRFAIMNGKDVMLVGKWYQLNGLYFSNLNWQYVY